MQRPWLGSISFLLVVSFLVSCGGDDHHHRSPILFGPEGNRLHAYSTTDPGSTQIVVQTASEDPVNGRDVNGQVCFFPPDGGPRRFMVGEDTGQPNPPPGWGIFELSGDEIGELSARQVGKLQATFQPPAGTADPYGCGFLSTGEIVTTDIGNTASGPPTGQLILWFSEDAYCKLDIAIGTTGGIYVDDEDRIYVASARETSGILRYTGPFPTSNDAAGGCGRTDSTGAPLADQVNREVFIPADVNIATPSGVVGAPGGGFFVSSVFNGVIAEYDADGSFVRRILQPPAGETLGTEPYSTGTPFGIAIDRHGNVYYSDLGIVIRGSNIGPGPRTGTIRQIAFDDGAAEPPLTFQAGLSFPDGVGVLD